MDQDKSNQKKSSALNSPFKEANRTNQLCKPERLNFMCSRIVCSGNISRQNLDNASLETSLIDDDEEFYSNLMSRIQNTDPTKSNESYATRTLTTGANVQRKRKYLFDSGCENLIKQFKENINQQTSLSSKCDSVAIRSDKIVRNKISKQVQFAEDNRASCVQEETRSVVTPQIFNMNIKRNTGNKLLFQMTSKICKDEHIVSPISKKTTVFETEIEELFCYELQCITPPGGCKNDED